MNDIKRIFALLLLSFMLISCQDQFLNKKPKNIYTENDVWESSNLVKSYLSGIYSGIGYWGVSMDATPYNMPANLTDEAMTARQQPHMRVFPQGKYTSSEIGLISAIWSEDYKTIRKCNLFLKQVDNVQGLTKSEIKEMKAQVRFIRAKKYEELVNWYSWWEGTNNGVPIIKKPLSLNDKFNKKRASYSEVVNFIVDDIDFAATNLPEQWPADEFGKITRGAALALKSEILLYAASEFHNPNNDESKWQKAANAAKAVIDMGKYSLDIVNNVKDYEDIFLNTGSVHPGTILARPFDPEHLPHTWLDRRNAPNGYKGWGGTCPNQTFVEKFEMANGKKITDPNSGFDPQQPYKGRELRFYANIVFNGKMYRGRNVETFLPGGKDSKDGYHGFNSCATGYYIQKFMDESVDFSVNNPPTPHIIFRLAEIYLNYAEAEYHLGNENLARTYVNKIRVRANLPKIKSSGNQLFHDIMHERTIELAFENSHRWNDTRRWDILKQTYNKNYIGMRIQKDKSGNLTYKKVSVLPRGYNKRMYSLPIPLKEIEKTNLKQNPGY